MSLHERAREGTTPAGAANVPQPPRPATRLTGRQARADLLAQWVHAAKLSRVEQIATLPQVERWERRVLAQAILDLREDGRLVEGDATRLLVVRPERRTRC